MRCQLDFFGRAGFLAAEIIAWHAEHNEAAIATSCPQLLPADMLGRKAAERGRGRASHKPQANGDERTAVDRTAIRLIPCNMTILIGASAAHGFRDPPGEPAGVYHGAKHFIGTLA
jgi:hypothetical protein